MADSVIVTTTLVPDEVTLTPTLVTDDVSVNVTQVTDSVVLIANPSIDEVAVAITTVSEAVTLTTTLVTEQVNVAVTTQVDAVAVSVSNEVGPPGADFNARTDWLSLCTGYSAIPTGPIAITGGGVYTYTYTGGTRYRFVSTDALTDRFYTGFDGTNLTGLVASKALSP